MLNPEVWDFKAPQSKFTNAVGAQTLPAKTNTFYYNHLISVITPTGLTIPKDALTADSDYYKFKDITLDTFVSRDFINNFIKKGELTALTIGTRIDCDNCVCITPCGKLILSLTKESYECLGLQGKESHYTKGTKNKYIVTVNLRGAQLVENKKNADVPKCLLRLGCFTMIAAWEPPAAEVCPSSLAKYINELGVDVKLCSNLHNYQQLNDVKVPLVRYDMLEDAMDVVEWLGIVTLKCPAAYEGTYMSSYRLPTPNVVVKHIGSHQFTGFFTAKKVVAFIEAMRTALKDTWFSVYVQGFSDSPVNWQLNEHHYYSNGDNGYAFLFSKHKHMFVTNQTSNKRYK